MERIALVGAGMVGRAWAMVFARAGHPVVLYDVDVTVLEPGLRLIEKSLADLRAQGLIDEEPGVVRQRITVASKLEDALRDATYVQESALEKVEAKREVFAAMDAVA